ncbi:hypothetical protein ACTD5D_23510 [Nocardia takedensis]|uniref:hypothetical protein n=1 Tax=Nocardia takedensis TaxID=259390 RepID=UPI0002E3C22E|nr:hypothetical protein [Nocardia takedensis]
MTVQTTPWTMISDRSPEFAYRGMGSGERIWQLSWLPDRPLTRAQALAGMELDELVSAPELVDDPVARAAIVDRAEVLDIGWEDAVILLAREILARAEDDPDTALPPLGEALDA